MAQGVCHTHHARGQLGVLAASLRTLNRAQNYNPNTPPRHARASHPRRSLRSHKEQAMAKEELCRQTLGKHVGTISFCSHLQDHDSATFSSITDVGLGNSEVLSRGMVDLLDALEKHPLVIGAHVCWS